jgi:ATP-dependent DNA helicase PIF1
MSEHDSLRSSVPFGGIVVVLGGDLRQLLPVVEGGSWSTTVDAVITNSPSWNTS